MNKGYWIVRADVSNTEAFMAYASKAPDIEASSWFAPESAR